MFCTSLELWDQLWTLSPGAGQDGGDLWPLIPRGSSPAWERVCLYVPSKGLCGPWALAPQDHFPIPDANLVALGIWCLVFLPEAYVLEPFLDHRGALGTDSWEFASQVKLIHFIPVPEASASKKLQNSPRTTSNDPKAWLQSPILLYISAFTEWVRKRLNVTPFLSSLALREGI